LKTHPLPPHDVRTDRWKTLATNRKATATVASATLKALANADDANFEGIRKAYEDVSARCNACHRAMSREAPTIKPD
jgi:cytochrome c556